jgi:DtxR family Mn-dependent transcriptional regulator
MEEVLEAIWTLEEKDRARVEKLDAEAKTEITEDLLASLCAGGLITIDVSGAVALTPSGRGIAERIIRRHRLAERLVCDVLGVRVEETEEAACEFEHIVADNITSSICTLLGHPSQCPHMRPIPEGECCMQARADVKPIVIPCDRLGVGSSARIAYLSARDHGRMVTLTSMGVTPGATIRLLQRRPAFVIQCEEAEIAIDRDVAREIYVWQ